MKSPLAGGLHSSIPAVRERHGAPSAQLAHSSIPAARGAQLANKRGSLLLPEGGLSEPQPGAAAAIDRLDEIDTGDGVFN
jgi:hypothetical protein